MTAVLALITFIVPAFLLYSPKVEQNRILTITKPLVITQERKTPAYYLYQQVKASEQTAQAPAAITTYLSSQNYIPPQPEFKVAEIKVSRREIASDVDAGFNTEAIQPLPFIAPKKTENSFSPSAPLPSETASYQTQQPDPTKLSPGAKWATVRGKFETRGIGVIDQSIELKRVEEGQVRELGRVDLKAGLYSIDIQSPQGVLVAEIRDRNGILIGVDRQKIVNLLSRGQYFEGPFIQVRNTPTVAANPDLPSRRTVSTLRDFDSKNGTSRKISATTFVASLFSKQNILDKPTEEYSNISRNSSTISYLTDNLKMYRKVLTIRQTGDESHTPVFSEKWVQGILDYISDQQKIEFKSDKIPVLIGRVITDGKPSAGVQVQVENHPGFYPIYLDQFMIPDKKLNQTSENGYFVFVGLEEGSYMMSAFKQDQIVGHQMFIAEQGSVTYQNVVATTKAQAVIIRSFDGFTSEPVDVNVTTPDLEDVIETSVGTAQYYKHSDLGVTRFFVRPNKRIYLPMIYFQDARKEYVHIPLIQEAWLQQIQAQRMINDTPEGSTFIGFVPDFDYQVYLVFEGYSKDQVVYFDSQGRVSPVPVKGGGFILFNVPQSAHEVIVQQEGTDRIFSQVIINKVNQLEVAHFAE